MKRTYSDLLKLPTFEDRYRYCRLDGIVCKDTFGSDRYLNQMFYTSPEWRNFRKKIIIRDGGFDLGCKDRLIVGRIFVHHLNPLTVDELSHGGEELFNPENFICVSYDTHQAIHYGAEHLLIASDTVKRTPNDTCPWR